MMVGGEIFLITLTTGILGYVSQNKQKENFICIKEKSIRRNTELYGSQ